MASYRGDLEILKAMHEHSLDLTSQAGLVALKSAVEELSQLVDKATEESPRYSQFVVPSGEYRSLLFPDTFGWKSSSIPLLKERKHQ